MGRGGKPLSKNLGHWVIPSVIWSSSFGHLGVWASPRPRNVDFVPTPLNSEMGDDYHGAFCVVLYLLTCVLVWRNRRTRSGMCWRRRPRSVGDCVHSRWTPNKTHDVRRLHWFILDVLVVLRVGVNLTVHVLTIQCYDAVSRARGVYAKTGNGPWTKTAHSFWSFPGREEGLQQ